MKLPRQFESLEQVPAAAIVIAGVVLSGAAALVPNQAHAFELLPLQLAAGVLPYLLLGMLAWMLREPVVIRAGLAVFAVHLLAVIMQRGLSPDHGSGPLLTAVPLLLAAGLLVLWPRALRASDATRRNGALSPH